MSKPKVVLFATGGTIASRYDAALGRTVASQRAEDLLETLPQVGEVADLEIDNFATIPSFDMSVQFAFSTGDERSTRSSRVRMWQAWW